MYQILLYTTERGDSPIDEFLDELDKKSRAKSDIELAERRMEDWIRQHPEGN